MDIFKYNEINSKLRYFFREYKNYIEVPSQSRLSILAACEEPRTISKFHINNIPYPLPQTGQMWLEVELLKNPKVPGVFCTTTSYRDEPHPIEGRHQRVFPMFEFESHGTLEDLRALESELLEFLGFSHPVRVRYDDACHRYGTDELTADHEERMMEDYGTVISLELFPKSTSPFWNMKYAGNDVYQKIDVILHGMETIGSAEREVDTDRMRQQFMTISGGAYADTLFHSFGHDRVMAELDEYLMLSFFPRFGGGIGLTRLARAMENAGLLNGDLRKAA